MAICKKASRALARQGVCERDELMAEGCLALSMRKPDTEGLAVKIARDAMIDLLRKSERRNRGRVEVRSGHYAEVNGWDVSDGDQWDATVYGKQKIQPVHTHPDLWEAMKALPEREYRAVTLFYWGGMTQEEIAVEIGIDQQSVSRILKSALKILHTCVNGDSRTVTNRGKRNSTDGPIGPHGGGVGQ
jgi:RNA polymerase sigma factor (sigma-70 family)